MTTRHTTSTNKGTKPEETREARRDRQEKPSTQPGSPSGVEKPGEREDPKHRSREMSDQDCGCGPQGESDEPRVEEDETGTSEDETTKGTRHSARGS